jgi:hypothetical protein
MPKETFIMARLPEDRENVRESKLLRPPEVFVKGRHTLDTNAGKQLSKAATNV